MTPSVSRRIHRRKGLAALTTVIFAGTTIFAGAPAVYATEAPPEDPGAAELSETPPEGGGELEELDTGSDDQVPAADEAELVVVEKEATVAPFAITPMAAGDPLGCLGQVYVQKGGSIHLFDTNTNQVVNPAVATGQKNNGLGIGNGGRYVYTIENNASNQTNRIAVFDTQSGTTQTYNAPSGAPSSMLRGAVNPATGIYYYAGGANSSGNGIWLGALTPSGQTFKVGQINGTSGANGDMAFTASGTLIVVADRNVYSVDGTIPGTAGSAQLSVTSLATLPSGTQGNGIAFGGFGHLYISTSTQVHKLDPATGVSQFFEAGSGNTDMGSCSFPNTLTVQKDISGDRALPGDQFQLNLTGGHFGTTVKSNTTAGSATGLQAQRTGPEFINQGTAYTIAEAAAGTTNLAMYGTTVNCYEYVTKQEVATTGEAPEWTVSSPASAAGVDVVCTITNTAKSPEISLAKEITNTGTGAGGMFLPGDTVEYGFVITNTGPVTLTGVKVEDPLTGLSAITYGTWPGDSGVLKAGESVTATASLTLTQAQFDAGVLLNTATASGTPPAGAAVTSNDSEKADFVLDPSIELTKSVADGEYGLGSTITYSFLVENTGNTTLNGVAITDPLPGLSTITYSEWPGAPNVLKPGETVTATATVTVTEAHMAQGYIDNTATVVGTPPNTIDPETGNSVPSSPVTDEDSESITIAGEPGINLVKEATLTGGDVAGSTVTYTFTATNTGNVTLTDVSIADPLAGLSALTYGAWPTAEGLLLAGESISATATYTLTQADVDAGGVANLATAYGTPPAKLDPNGDPVESDPISDEDPAFVKLTPHAAIEILKTGALDITEASKPGDLATYTFTVTNTGTVTLTDVGISDPKLSAAGVDVTFGDWPGAEGALAPWESVVGTATYPITQADIDAGEVVNVATATGTPPDVRVDPNDPESEKVPSDPVTDSDEERLPVNLNPVIDLVKTGVLDTSVSPTMPGTEIAYTFAIANTGNVLLKNVYVEDVLPGLSDVTYDWNGAANEGELAVGESITATATYALTAGDIVAGKVDNQATAYGTTPTGASVPGGEPVTVDDSDDNVIALQADPSISLVKTANVDSFSAVGDEIEYTFVVENTGNVVLTDVTLTDALPGLTDITVEWPGAAGVLAVGQSATGTATLSITQAHLDKGVVKNAAAVTGQPPADPNNPEDPVDPVGDEDDVTTIGEQDPSVSVVKSGLLDGQAAAGETVSYTFTATNTGNVTLTGVAISDPLPGLSALVYGEWPGADGVLAPGESVTATAVYTLTQADVDAGGVANVAGAVGTPPNAFDPEDPEGPGIPQEPVTDEDPEFVVTPHGPALQLVKSGSVEDGAGVGDLVTYTFTATNIGNVTLSEVTVEDELEGLSDLDFTCPGAAGVLAPGQSVVATATYVLTQADVDAGHVDNVAAATGTPPTIPGEEPPAPLPPVEDEEIVLVPADPSISLEKSSELAGEAAAGDLVHYTFTATNSGNVTLTGVEITDPMPGLSAITYGEWPGAEGVLAPGQSVTATASYTLTQGDVDAGSLENTATAEGTPPNAYDPEDPEGEGIPQEPVTDDDTVETPLPADPSIELVKKGVATGGAKVGDKINYTLTATNTGNVTLSGVVITDKLPGLSKITYQWPGEDGVLAPGQSVNATATYTLTAADIATGKVINKASVAGFAPLGDDPVGGQEVVDADQVTITTAPAGTLPKTGAEVAFVALLALLMVSLGGAALVVRRREQNA